MVFVSSPSSTNEVNIAYGVNTGNTQVSPASTQVSTDSTQVSTANLSDDTVYAFLASQPNGSQLVYEDLEQIHEDDVEEMDLKWQLALLSIRTKMWSVLTATRWDTLQGNAEDLGTKIAGTGIKTALEGLYMADDEVPTNMDLMAFSDSENEVIFCEQLAVLKRDISYKDVEISMLKSELEKLKQEKESNQLKIEKFDNASKSLNKLIRSQITDKSRKGVGFVSYNVVPPPYTGLFSPPNLDLSYYRLKEFQQPEFEGYGPKTSKSVSEDISNEVRESPNAPLVEELASYDKLEKKTVFPTIAKIKFVRPKQQEKPVRKPVKYTEMYRSQGPRGNQRNWNNQKSQQLESDFVMYNKTYFVCGSFDHVQADCNYHQRERLVSGNNYTRVNYNYSAKKVHPSTHRNMAPIAVLMKTGLKILNTTRPVNTAHPKTTVYSARPMSHFSKSAQSTVKRPYQIRTTLTNKNFSQKVNTTKGKFYTARLKAVNTARLNSAVVNTVRVNQTSWNLIEDMLPLGEEPNEGKLLMCDKKNNVLFTDTGCFVLSPDFKLADEIQVLLKVPRKNNMYSVDMKNIVPKESLTCLVAKATLDESMLWHRRLGKATQSLFLTNKKYCLVITDDYSRFTWVFFLATKDETSGILKSFITEKGIKREFSVARTPQQNGIAERRNRTLIEAARTMLADSKLPIRFWTEAVNTACYVQNRVLVVKPHNKTPYELFRGRTPSLSFMKPFGCQYTILNTLDHLGKFDGKSDDGFFVGYSLKSKAFRVYNIRTRKVKENLHVRFLEDKTIIAGDGPKWLFDIGVLTKSMNYVPVVTGTNSNDFVDGSPFDSSSKDASNDEPQPFNDAEKKDDEGGINDQERTENSTQDVKTAGLSINIASKNFNTGSLNINTVSPTVPTAPLESTYADFFSDELELDLSNIATTYLVPSTPNTRIHKDHSLDHVIGDMQSGVQTRRMINEQRFISVVYDEKTHKDLHTCLFAYFLSQEEPKKVIQALKDPSLIEAMQEELLQFKLQQVWTLVDLPYGLREIYVCQPPGFEDPEFSDKVYKVEKALYGLHQAPRAWYETLSTYLLDNGFQRVTQKDDGIFISQDKYVDEILKKFGFSTMKTTSTPMETLKPLLKDAEAEDVDVHLYRSMIGSLMYLTASRPDIMFDVCACARFQVTPKVSHLHAVKRIFRYLKGEPKLGLWYPKDSPFDFEAYTDSDYDGAIANSTTEAEYVAAAYLLPWSIFYYSLVFLYTVLTIYIVKNPVFHSKTKHIEIRHHFIRDSNEKKLIQMIKIHTDHNVADLLTRAFDVGRFQYQIASIGMLNL
ncbi:putative ribonuclease H-like domain-containing protein [Tanacetum coccineum]